MSDHSKESNGEKSRELLEMNEALLVSSVRQHELTELAEKAEAEARRSEKRLREIHKELLAASVRQRELTEIAEKATAESRSKEKRLSDSNVTLRANLDEIRDLNTQLEASRRETLKLLEDSVRSRETVERLNRELHQEIAERQAYEEALRKSEKKYRTLFESIDEGFCTIEVMFDPEGKPFDYRFLEANPAFVRQTGLENFLGRTMLDFAPDMEQFWFDAYGRIAMTGEAKRFQHEARELGRHYDVWAFTVGDGPFPRKVAVIFNDITERKRAEDALRESELLSRVTRLELETTYRTAPFGMCQLDRDLRYTRVNERLAEMNGFPAGDHMGRSIFDMVPDLAPKIAEQYRRILETGEPIVDIEISGETAAQPGIKRWWLESWFPQRDVNGEIIGINIVAHEITEKKIAEDRLKESQERFRLAQQAGGVGVWDWDAVTNETYWSETMWAFYAVEPQAENPADSFWSDHLHPEDREHVEQHVAEMLQSKSRNYNDEFRIVAEDGAIRWVEATATVLRDADGKPTRMYGVNIDITERKAAEEKIRTSEVQLRLVTDAMPALISYVDREMRYRIVNQTYSDWFGQSHDDLVGRTIEEVVGTQAYESIKPHIDRVMGGEEHSFQTTLNYKTAGSRFVQVSYVPDKLVDGSVVGFYALVNDLSELKRSQDLLQASQERYRNVVLGLTEHAIFSTDTEGRIDSWNPGAAKIFGYTADEAIGQNIEILFTPEDRAGGVPAEELRNARAEGRAADDRWHVRKDGSRFYASGMVTPLYLGRALAGFAKIATDLTEKKRHAEALQRAHDELEVRVAERTRELAQTNKALVAEVEERKAAERETIELLQRVVTTQEEERTRIARDLHDQLGQRLTALRLKIASLPEAFRDEALLRTRTGRLQEISEGIDSEVSFLAWALRPAALDELGLAEAIKAHMNEWSRHYEIAADFHASGLGEQRLGQIVETHLYRIVQEALNNTAKHASATEVTILLERMNNHAVLIVEDDGVGFEPRDGTRAKRGGKGLGLAGMRERAVLIGGELEIESSKGSGTTIFVRVPIENVEGENGNA